MRDNMSAFNSFEYDSKISSALPYYEEFHSQVMDMVRAMNFKKINWLDTGCGTGKTARKALAELSGMEITFTLCDISGEMLKIARGMLGDNGITYRNISSQELDYREQFDIVTAIQCHYYLPRAERETAVKNCFQALKENGIFITFENIRLENDNADLIAVRRWQNYMLSKGRKQQEIQSHIERCGTEILPITITEHFDLLKKSGFRWAEPLWFSYVQAVFFAIK